jgi:MoxR-like ATPase
MCLTSRMEFERVAQAILGNIEKVIDGKPQAAEAALVVFLAEGHLLIEDVPGVGKTVLAKALGRSVSCSVRRIQFTPDLLPSDITGVSVYNQVDREFEFKPGAVFANIVIGDEINRASPKTQSALLEAMEERQVTYALPEAQRDRFMARISMGYPDADAELAMVRGRDADNPFDELSAVASIEDITMMIAAARAIHVSESVERYVVNIAQATRIDTELRLGASPRATLQLIRAAKARAAVQGRDFVLPDDVDALVPVVLPHRLIPMRGVASVHDVVARIVAETPVPAGAVQPS